MTKTIQEELEDFRKLPQVAKDLLPPDKRRELYRADREERNKPQPKQLWEMSKAEREALSPTAIAVNRARTYPGTGGPSVEGGPAVPSPLESEQVAATPEAPRKAVPAKKGASRPVPVSEPTVVSHGEAASPAPVTPQQKAAVESYLRQKYGTGNQEVDEELAAARQRDLDMGLLDAGARLGHNLAYAGVKNRQEYDNAGFKQQFMQNAKNLQDDRETSQKRREAAFNFDRKITGAEREDRTYSLNEEQRTKMADPSSGESVARRQVISRLVKGADKIPGFSNMTAAQLDSLFPQFSQVAESEHRASTAAETRRHNLATEGLERGKMDAARAQASKDNLKAVTEIEDRHRNIQTNVSKLKQLINDYGTQELVGPQNAIMNQLIESIATDQAKMNDPGSVARPQEVEAIKQTLFKPGFWQQASTAQASLDNFMSMADDRRLAAYSVRKMEVPQGPSAAQPAQGAQGAPNHNAAVTWAKSNPQDPRSAEILRRNGVK